MNSLSKPMGISWISTVEPIIGVVFRKAPTQPWIVFLRKGRGQNHQFHGRRPGIGLFA